MDEEEEGEYYEDEDEEGDVLKVKQSQELDPSLMIENLGLCQESIAALEKRGIKALFAIQKAVFEPAVQGRDLIGRAKTGSGKTLAFALPVIESIVKVRRVDFNTP
jgi:ATP-dependent RNA helicase DDX21